MEYLLVITVCLSLAIAFFCSISEAALYAVPLPHVRHLATSGKRAGKLLAEFKSDMARPITAILILNTFANTTGPAIGGAVAELLFGQSGILYFAILMSIAVLFIGEIVPKFLGVTYSRQVSAATVLPLAAVVRVCSPIIGIANVIMRRIEPEIDMPTVSHEEVLSMAAIGADEGALDHLEGSVIRNVIGLDRVLVRDILTPRVVVFRVAETSTLAEVQKELFDWNFTRVPTYREEDPDVLTGYVRQRDIYRALIKEGTDKNLPLRQIARPLQTVPELMRADKLLLKMFEDREHICSVVDEHGALAGIITLEDILEEMVGREIVDEYDVVR